MKSRILCKILMNSGHPIYKLNYPLDHSIHRSILSQQQELSRQVLESSEAGGCLDIYQNFRETVATKPHWYESSWDSIDFPHFNIELMAKRSILNANLDPMQEVSTLKCYIKIKCLWKKMFLIFDTAEFFDLWIPDTFLSQSPSHIF